jgi:hypothetical protein
MRGSSAVSFARPVPVAVRRLRLALEQASVALGSGALLAVSYGMNRALHRVTQLIPARNPLFLEYSLGTTESKATKNSPRSQLPARSWAALRRRWTGTPASYIHPRLWECGRCVPARATGSCKLVARYPDAQ